MNQLQATLNDLAAGRVRPVQWLNMETKALPTSGSRSKSNVFQNTGPKDDRIAEAQTDESLRSLSQARLKALLAAQQAIARTPICKRLPDGGAKILKKIAQIQEALDYVIKVDALVASLSSDFGRLELGQGSSELDQQIRTSATMKLEKLSKAKQPYSQASNAVSLAPSSERPGMHAKQCAAKFLPFSEAAELSRASKLAAIEQEQVGVEDRHHTLVPSKGSAFYSARWNPPSADFSKDHYRDGQESEDDDSEELDDSELDEEAEEDESVPIHLQW